MTWAKRTLGLWIALVATTSMAGTRFKDARIDILGLAPIEAVVMRLPVDESPDFPRQRTVDRVDAEFVPTVAENPSPRLALVEKYYDFSTGFLKPKATLHVQFWLKRNSGGASVLDPVRLRDVFVQGWEQEGLRDRIPVHFAPPIPDQVGSSGAIELRAEIGSRLIDFYLYPMSPDVYGELIFDYAGPREVGWERNAKAVEDQIVASVRFDRTTSP